MVCKRCVMDSSAHDITFDDIMYNNDGFVDKIFLSGHEYFAKEIRAEKTDETITPPSTSIIAGEVL